MLNVVMQSVIMGNVNYKPFTLSVVMLSVVMLSVKAPHLGLFQPCPSKLD
jgi:hypothetical protein